MKTTAGIAFFATLVKALEVCSGEQTHPLSENPGSVITKVSNVHTIKNGRINIISSFRENLMLYLSNSFFCYSEHHEPIAKLQFWPTPAFFVQDSDASQIAYSQSSMSICEEPEPTQKSSGLDSKASVATDSNEKNICLSCSSHSVLSAFNGRFST